MPRGLTHVNTQAGGVSIVTEGPLGSLALEKKFKTRGPKNSRDAEGDS